MKRLLILLFAASSLTAVGQVPDNVPTQGLVAWYPMGASLENAFGDDYDGELFSIGMTEGANADPSGASVFNGTEGYGYVENGLFLEGDFSVSFWMRSDLGTFNYNPIVMIGDGLTCENELSQLEIYVGNGGITVSHNRTQSNSSYHYFQAVSHFDWVHVGFSLQSGTMTMYVQGLPVEQAMMSDLMSLDLPLFVGYTQFINGGECIVNHFEGALDELGFWNRGLDDAEMMAVYLSAIVYGCTDIQACNYNENANQDDGTCATCAALATACGEGTIWDEDSHTCIVANPSDSNFDGCVQLNDLLDLLSAYGDCGAEESAWQCGDPLEYQGYDYETVQIGEQCWFAENLHVDNYSNGDLIPASLSNAEWQNTASGAQSVYGEGNGECDTFSPGGDSCDESWALGEYGRLYNWHSVADERGLCPGGWSVPANESWTMLVEGLGGESQAGHHMKSQTGWFENGHGTNSSGFDGLPGGDRSAQGEFEHAGQNGAWWSASSNGPNAWLFFLGFDTESIESDDGSPKNGFSVRCIKDAE